MRSSFNKTQKPSPRFSARAALQVMLEGNQAACKSRLHLVLIPAQTYERFVVQSLQSLSNSIAEYKSIAAPGSLLLVPHCMEKGYTLFRIQPYHSHHQSNSIIVCHQLIVKHHGATARITSLARQLSNGSRDLELKNQLIRKLCGGIKSDCLL